MLENFIRDLVRQAVKEALTDLQNAAPARSTSAEYLTLSEAAALAKVSKTTLRAWIRDGSLKAVGRDRTVRVRLADLHNALGDGKAHEDDEPDASAAAVADEVMRRAARTGR